MRTWLKMNAVAIFAIIVIAFLEYTALSHGIDGISISLAIGAIAGLGGYKLRDLRAGREPSEPENPENGGG